MYEPIKYCCLLVKLPKTVFLCDDDPDDRLLICAALTEVAPDISIIKAKDGLDLLEIIEQHNQQKTALFLLDMNMPRLNGLETIQHIRSMPGFCDTPAIMFSTSSDPELVHRAIFAGINHYIYKPNTFEGFIELAQFVNTSYLK
jgi:CheY-like chemotaxis protein